MSEPIENVEWSMDGENWEPVYKGLGFGSPTGSTYLRTTGGARFMDVNGDEAKFVIVKKDNDK